MAKLGGRLWARQKQAVENAVNDLASDMLQVQALRSTRPGIAFPADTEWQTEFDASFPYLETDDQLAAIEAIKQDMCEPRPMDRLLCGDVGFGKTEVSMRAAFSGGCRLPGGRPRPHDGARRAAPRTFSSRLAEFLSNRLPVAILHQEKQAETIERLALGKVDIDRRSPARAARRAIPQRPGNHRRRAAVWREIKERLKAHVRSSTS